VNIALDQPELERFVASEMASGRFKTPEEVVASALTLLQTFGSPEVETETELRSMITAGIDEADRGHTVPWIPGQIRREVELRATQRGHD
jgi:putative addiction module CopG family antidote